MRGTIPAPQPAGYRRRDDAPQAHGGPRTDYEISGYTVDFIRSRPEECVLVTDDEGTRWRIPRSVVAVISDRGFDGGVAACQSTHGS